jgi:amidase
MKPSRGRVSGQPGGAGWLGLSIYGGLARTVSDSALILDAMHGALVADASPLPPFTGRYVEAAGRDPGRLRIALSRKVPPGVLTSVSGEQREAWERTGALLSTLGHDVIERDPAYGLAQLEFFQTWVRGIYEASLAVPDRSLLEPSTRQMAALGRYLVPPFRRAALLAHRPVTTARILALWDEIDVLVTPGTARTAIAAEGGYGRPALLAVNVSGRFTPFTSLFNFTGQPAVTLPAGMGQDGLPLSVQLVGRHGAEDVLYSLAGQIEVAAPWGERRPTLADQ